MICFEQDGPCREYVQQKQQNEEYIKKRKIIGPFVRDCHSGKSETIQAASFIDFLYFGPPSVECKTYLPRVGSCTWE
jgi:hypothetical protein